MSGVPDIEKVPHCSRIHDATVRKENRRGIPAGFLQEADGLSSILLIFPRTKGRTSCDYAFGDPYSFWNLSSILRGVTVARSYFGRSFSIPNRYLATLFSP